MVRVDPKGAIAHAEGHVAARQLTQLVGDIDVVALGAIFGVQNHVLAFVAVVGIAVPAAIPAFAAPLAPAPACELRAIHRAAFAVLKHARTTVRAARVNAQHLDLARIRIETEGTIPHAEDTVRARQFTQPVRYIDVVPLRPVFGVKNLVLPRVAIAAVPVARVCAIKLRAIDGAALGKLQHLFAPVGTAGKDAQGLSHFRRRVGTEGAVTHAEPRLTADDFPQALRDVNPTIAGTVIGAFDVVLLGCGEHRGESKQHHGDREVQAFPKTHTSLLSGRPFIKARPSASQGAQQGELKNKETRACRRERR